MSRHKIFHIGTAGWGIPLEHDDLFLKGDSHLARYAKVFNCAEINTSFYRPHRPATYKKWAEITPPDFRFSVKLPRQISHESGLHVDHDLLQKFLDEVSYLGDKLGPLLVQLPPRQLFIPGVALPFFTALRKHQPRGPIVLEPRHKEWFSPEVDTLLQDLSISRVSADPPPVPEATQPGGDLRLIYYRLHGSPRTYYSRYSAERVVAIGSEMREHSASGAAWCIFDNTASGAATSNAVALNDLLVTRD